MQLNLVFVFVFLCVVLQSTECLQAVYRWYHEEIHDHFYTVDPNGEQASAGGYIFEGIEFYISPAHLPGMVPLFKLWKSGSNHLYTTDTQESVRAQKRGYAYSGVLGYVYTENRKNTVPLNRYYSDKDNDHFYTISRYDEKLRKSGYSFEGVACYVYASLLNEIDL